MPVTHASCVRVPAKQKFLPMLHVRWPLLLQSCVLVQPESSTVTLDIDIREKCLLYGQNLLNLVNSTIKQTDVL